MIQKHIFQIVDHDTGIRSEPLHCSFEELKAELRKIPKSHEHYILLVATLVEDNGKEEFIIPRAPLIRVSTLIKDDQEKAANG